MSNEALRVSINTQFTDNWVATSLEYVDRGDNHEFDPPSKIPWVRLTSTIIGGENAEVGSNFQRSTGLILVKCFVPINDGEKSLNALLDDAMLVFQNKNFGGVRCFATMPIRIGPIGEWYQINSQTDFQYDVFS